ncbi:MAG: hypothetical protein P8H56_02225 [Crocinitomicaceae bacterium]|nr:hypothetical protein [Crocinitomicaceae bacterium]MDG1657380.1 hypothetical protein [Crocinitomicaceae bacterium]
MKTLNFIIGILFLGFSLSVSAQQNNVGINTNTPDPSAVLHLESDSQGLLVPTLTALQRDAIAAPATGLIIYNTDDNQEEIYNGTCWIPSYLKTCDDCLIDIAFAQPSYPIDRINQMSVVIPVTIIQTTPSAIALPVEVSMVHTFTEESDVLLDFYALPGSGVVNLTINTNVFERGGSHYVTIFANCGDAVIAKSIAIDVNPCALVSINSDQTNYDLAATGVTGNNCVVVTIEENVSIRSADPAIPAFTTGAINPACNLGILNKGLTFGLGGDGPLLMGTNGEDGGTAMEINCNAEVRNEGMIYGGGGSGLTVGAFVPVGVGPFNICFAVGAGGGGGMPDGLGGGDTQGTCTFVVGPWFDGNNAESLYDDDEGVEVNKTVSTPFSAGPIQGMIVITARGGSGGDFGEPGTGSPQPVDFSGTYLEICLNIPFLGIICAPVPGLSGALNGISNTINNAFNSSVPGAAGYAIKRLGTLTIPDGDYQNPSLRGPVGP